MTPQGRFIQLKGRIYVFNLPLLLPKHIFTVFMFSYNLQPLLFKSRVCKANDWYQKKIKGLSLQMCYLSDLVESAPLSVIADAFILPIEMPVTNGFYCLRACAAPCLSLFRSCQLSKFSSVLSPTTRPIPSFSESSPSRPPFSPLATKPPTWVCGHRGSVNYNTKSTLLTAVSSLRSPKVI